MISAYSNRERIILSEVDSFKRFPINGEFKHSQKIHQYGYAYHNAEKDTPLDVCVIQLLVLEHH